MALQPGYSYSAEEQRIAYHSAMSQHALGETVKQIKKSLEAPSDHTGAHSQQQQTHWPAESTEYHYVADAHSFFNSSAGSCSTPSDNYDENAENIDPNSSERQPYRLPPHSLATNILCDSQAHPVAPLPQSNPSRSVQPEEDIDLIAAPVPLSYSARSKQVLSAMISPAQPPGFQKPVPIQPAEPTHQPADHIPHQFAARGPQHFAARTSEQQQSAAPGRQQFAESAAAPRKFAERLPPSAFPAAERALYHLPQQQQSPWPVSQQHPWPVSQQHPWPVSQRVPRGAVDPAAIPYGYTYTYPPAFHQPREHQHQRRSTDESFTYHRAQNGGIYLLPVSNHREAAATPFSSNAAYSPAPGTELCTEMPAVEQEDTDTDTTTAAHTHRRRYIRPITPGTLIALTDPVLMGWVEDYPVVRASVNGEAEPEADGVLGVWGLGR